MQVGFKYLNKLNFELISDRISNKFICYYIYNLLIFNNLNE